MRSHSWINTAKKVIGTYDGSMPLAAWLKQFFKADKKFGSQDRKQISHLSYCNYRLGNAFKDIEMEERILMATFLCSTESNKVLEELKPAWNEKVSLSVDEKIGLLSASKEVETIFPFIEELSSEIDSGVFNRSFFIQPDLYLRIRSGKKEKVLKKFEEAQIEFDLCESECLQLSNQTKIDEIINLDEDAVVQDYNSQKVLNVLNHKLQTTNHKLSSWDCCAASGGKSILFHDRFPHVHLTVSDIRESILINLQNRFKTAGIKNYDHFIADVSSDDFFISRKFDVIICDAPCSGSGTWGRTPEQLSFFQREKIDHYVNLQKRIALNTGKALKKEGFFLYITCSVFKKENEEVVEFIQSNLPFKLIEMQYLKGYDKKADTLFVALFSQL